MSTVRHLYEIDESSQQTLENFEERFFNALNDSAMLQLVSLGHRTGLLDHMSNGHSVTSASLSKNMLLAERYVREWLGGMTVAGLLQHDPDSKTYKLPIEHGALLSNKGEVNLAVFSQFLPLLGSVEDLVVDSFEHGRGVPYSQYKRFHEVMAEDSGQTVLPALFDAILPIAPEVPARLESGIRVLDLGCGRGRAIMKMAARYPNSEFVGLDLSPEAIGWAQEQSLKANLSNVEFLVCDLKDFDETAPLKEFDLVTTFDAIHDQAHPINLLRGIHRTLKKDGVFIAQEIHSSSHHHHDREHPLGTLLYTISIMHCISVSLAQGGEGLGTMWGREVARQHFENAGFRTIEVHQLPHDIQNDYWILRP